MKKTIRDAGDMEEKSKTSVIRSQRKEAKYLKRTS